VFNKTSYVKEQVFQVLPDKFSYSQLKDFETCPLKYKYQYYLKLPVPGSQHLSFGNAMHKVFEEFLNKFMDDSNFKQQDLFGKSKQLPELPGFDFLEKLYQKHWVDEWYSSKEEKQRYLKLGKQIIREFYDYSKINLPKPKYIEQSFILFLNNYKLVSRIDRADGSDGGLIIYDYKTGQTPKKKDKKDLDQLYIYQWAAEEYLKEKVTGLKYWYLRNKENPFLEEELADSKQIEKLKEELLSLMDRIVETIKYDRFKEEHQKVKEHNCDFQDLE